MQETVKTSRISRYPVVGEKTPQVCQVELGETWMTAYQRYLADEILPLKLAEARKIKKNSSKYTLMGNYSSTDSPILYWYAWTMSNAHASWHNYTKGYAVATSMVDLSRQRPFMQDITGQP